MSQFTDFINFTEGNIKDGNSLKSTFLLTRNVIDDTDARFLKPKWWKLNRFGSLENSWCRFYIGDGQRTLLPDINYNDGVFSIEGLNDYLKNTLEDFIPIPGSGQDFNDDVLVFGVSINISKSPIITETNVKGFSTPIYQLFNNNAYDININFLDSGPHFWQQNSLQISKLMNILNSGQSINISNPELNLIYNIDKVVIKNISIGQDPRFYSHKNIALSFKSDRAIDIIQRSNDSVGDFPSREFYTGEVIV